jgi:hypothetical protein
LLSGEYRLKVSLTISGQTVDSVEDAARLTIIPSDYYGTGSVPWNGFIVLKQHWEFQADSSSAAH